MKRYNGTELLAALDRPHDRASVTRWARRLGHDDVGVGGDHEFSLEELLLVRLVDDVEVDFRDWLIETLATMPTHLLERGYLYVWPCDELGPGPWLLTHLETGEDLRDLIVDLDHTSALYFDLALARAELEEVLSC